MTKLTLTAAALIAVVAGSARADGLNAAAVCKTVQAAFPGSKVTVSGPNKMRVACPGSRDAVKVSIRMSSMDELQQAAAGHWTPGDDN